MFLQNKYRGKNWEILHYIIRYYNIVLLFYGFFHVQAIIDR